MIDFKLESILPNIFNMDFKDNENKDIPQISILTIKSLLPSGRDKGNRIDYKRFYEELKLWKYYRLGENPSLLNILEGSNIDVYFNLKDETLYSRILPIIIANESYEVVEEEVIKNILFTTGNLESLLEWLLVGRAIYSISNTQEDIIEDLKQYIINISQVDFLEKYKDYYRIQIEDFPNNYKITFERVRVDLLSLLNGISLGKYIFMEDILSMLKGDVPNTIFGRIIYNVSKNLDVESNLNNFYISMNQYILRLRKGRINPENLKIEEYTLPDIFKYEVGEVFFHSLLREGKIIKKEVKDGILTSLVQTRTGMYLFRRDPV